MKRVKRFIEYMATTYHVPMSDVEFTVEQFITFMLSGIQRSDEEATIKLSSPGFEAIPLVRGVTLIYGHPDVGKTAMLCGLLSSLDESYTAAYLDCEAKLTHTQAKHVTSRKHVAYAREYVDSGFKEVTSSGIIDVVLVDTITAIFGTSQHAFLKKLSECVPYIICAAQTRTNIQRGTQVAALAEDAYALARTIVQLTEREKVMIEGETCFRIYYTVKKSVEEEYNGKQGTFIIRKGVYDELYTAYDILKNNGIIRSIGGVKYMITSDDEEVTLGKITRLDKEQRDLIMRTYFQHTRR